MTKEQLRTLFDLYQNSLGGESDHTAVEYYSFDNKYSIIHRMISYEKLKLTVGKVSEDIVKSTEAFQIIGIHLEPSIELVIAMLSILKVKKIFVPLEMKPRSTSLEQTMSITGMKYILSSTTNYMDILGRLKNCQCKFKLVTEIDCEVGGENLILIEATLDTHVTELSLTDLAYVIRTSGTTGIPKNIAVPNSCIVPNIIHLSSMFSIRPFSKVALMSPPTFDPSIVEIFMAFYNHATLVIPSTSIKAQPLVLGDVLMNKGKVTVIQATPSLIRRFSADFLRSHIFCDRSSLDVMAFGGEACPSYRTILNWLNHQNVSRRKLPNKFFNVYGISEVSSWASSQLLHPEKILDCCSLPVSLGCPLLKTQMQIRNENSNEVLCQIDGKDNLNDAICSEEITVDKCKFPPDETVLEGKLYIGGKHRCCCIIGHEIEEYQDSGDIARIIFETPDDIPILKYIGRADSTVKRNGKKLNLHHLAHTVTNIDEVRFCHVIVINSNAKMMKVIAFLVRDSVCTAQLNTAKIITTTNSKMWTFNVFQKLSTDLDASQLPDRILEVSCLPVNSHGKVDETLLKQLLHDWNVSGSYEVDASYLKEVVTIILSSVLKDCMLESGDTQVVQPHLDFNKPLINLGGDSFTAAVLVNWLEVFLDTELSSVFPNIFETVLSTSLNEVIEKLSGMTFTSSDSRLSIQHRKRKFTEVDTVKKSSRLAEDGFPLSISRGSNMQHFDHDHLSSHTSYSCSDFTSNSKSTTISESWKYDTGKCVDASPLVYLLKENEGLIFIGSHSHRFLCTDLHGSIVWNVTLSDRIESSACLCFIGIDDFVAVGCYDHKVYLMKAKTGEIHCAFQTGAEIKSSPCWSQESKLLYCGSHDGHLYAFDIKEKECRWKSYCHGGAVYSSPSLLRVKTNQCLVFCATLQGRVMCYCGQHGEEKWNYLVGKPIFSSLSVDDSGVYFGCVDNRIYSLSLKGDLNWTFRTGSSIFSSPCISCCESSIIIGSHDGYLYKLSKQSGILVWKTIMSSDKSTVFSSPFSIAGMVVSASTNGYICVVDDNYGKKISQKKLPGEVFSSPVAILRSQTLDDSPSIMVFIGCRDNNLYSMAVDF